MSNSNSSKVDQLTLRLRRLEFEISDWGSKNSQSNPGAVMELRDMRKQRDALERELIYELTQQEAEKRISATHYTHTSADEDTRP
jgi:hypothetical protein